MSQALGLLGLCNYKQDVVFLQHPVGHWDEHMAVVPHTRDYKMVVLVVYLGDCLAENLGVGHAVAGNEYVLLVLVVGEWHVAWLDEYLAQEYHGKDYTNNTKRVGEGATQCCSAALYTQLLECLLCGRKCRCVGGGTAENTRHVRDCDIGCKTQCNGKQCAGEQYTNGRQQQFCSFAAHRTEETGTHLQAKCIDKEYKAERLGIEQHLAVDCKSEVSCKDTGKEYECYAKRDAEHTYASQHKADGRYQRYHYDGLQGRVVNEQGMKVVHIMVCFFALSQIHLLEQVACAANTVDDKEHVAYVDRYVTADAWVELDVAHCRTPCAVEVDTNELALAVDYRRS